MDGGESHSKHGNVHFKHIPTIPMYHAPTVQSIRGDDSADYVDHTVSQSRRTSSKVKSQNTVRGAPSQKASSKPNLSKRGSIVQGDSGTPARRKLTSEGTSSGAVRGGGGGPATKELREKCEKLENLLLHSLKVIEKIAVAMDGVPKAI